MKSIMGLAILVMVVLSACGIPTLASTATAEQMLSATDSVPVLVDISGLYTLSGTNFDGSVYTGEVEITESGGKYDIVWRIGARQVQAGTGTFGGTQLTAQWQEGQNSGDAVYTLQQDGSLSGIWTQNGRDGQGTESLIPEE